MKMNTLNLSRRSFMGLSVACSASSAFAGPKSIVQALMAEDGLTKVSKIVTENFGPLSNQGQGLKEFYGSLLRESQRHEAFQKKLGEKELANELKCFVVEEFAVRTNFLAISANMETTLKVIV